MTTPKQSAKNYRKVIDISLTQMYKRLTTLTQSLPNEITDKNITPEITQTIRKVEAIEEEWIIDPIQRMMMSLLTFEEGEEFE